MKLLNFRGLGLLCLTLLTITSCQKDDPVVVEAEKTTEVYFTASFPEQSFKKDLVDEPVPVDCKDVLTNEMSKTAYVTYTLGDDPTQYTFMSEVTIDKFYDEENQDVGTVDRLLTKLALEVPVTDEVSILSFYVAYTDGDGTPLMAVPVEGSIYSTFVAEPLEVEFDVIDGERKRYVDLEILCIDKKNEPKFGLRYFDLAVIRTMPFCVMGNICEDGRHREAEFWLKVYKFSGDCENPGEELIISSHNFDPDADGFANPDGSITEEDYDALLCTYLPDYTDEPNQQFWMEIYIYDPNNELTNYDDADDEHQGYYLFEAGILTEEEIKAKWEEDPDPETGADTNWFHFQAVIGDDCTGPEYIFDPCDIEHPFFYSVTSTYTVEGNLATANGIYRYTPSVEEFDQLIVLDYDWTELNPATGTEQYSIAYRSNADGSGVLYYIPTTASEIIVYTFDSDLQQTSKVIVEVDDDNIDRVFTQAVYHNGYLYLGDSSNGTNSVYVIEVDPGTGAITGPVTMVNQVLEVNRDLFEIKNGDLVVVSKADVECLRSVDFNGNYLDIEIIANGMLDGSNLNVVESSNDLNGIRASLVYQNRWFVVDRTLGMTDYNDNAFVVPLQVDPAIDETADFIKDCSDAASDEVFEEI